MKFKGIFPPMITVFKRDEEIDEEATRDHVDFLIENGVHGIIVGGSTGEFPHLSAEERKDLLQLVLDHVNDRVPVIAGTTACSTREVTSLSKHAEEVGADGLLIVPPYYYKVNEEELYQHFKVISENVNLPIMLYNNPWTSGINVSTSMLIRMARDGVIEYVKDTNGDVARIHEMSLLSKDNPVIFFGKDENAFEAFMVGASGWVSGAGNVVIKYERMMYEYITQGEYVKAREVYYKILPFFFLTERRGKWIAYVKSSLEMMGKRAGAPRRPLLPLSKSEEKELEEVLRRMELIE